MSYHSAEPQLSQHQCVPWAAEYAFASALETLERAVPPLADSAAQVPSEAEANPPLIFFCASLPSIFTPYKALRFNCMIKVLKLTINIHKLPVFSRDAYH
jgi:hypothetical protein